MNTAKKVIIVGNPRSDNHLYGHYAIGKRVIRFMTKEGKDYKKLVEMSCRKPFEPTKKQVSADVCVYFGDKRKHDIHGCLKVLLDSFEGILYDDDCQVVDIRARKFYDKAMPRSEVIITEIESEQEALI